MQQSEQLAKQNTSNIISMFIDVFEQQLSDQNESKDGYNYQYNSNSNQDTVYEEGEKSQSQYAYNIDEKEDNQFQKQNAIKNILKSFLKFLLTTTDMDIQQQYSQLYNPYKKIPYSEIKKQLSKRLKQKKTRWNIKLKSIVHSKRFQLIFFDYLSSKSNSWLNNSRVFDIASHQKVINQLICQIKNGEQQKIKIDKKK